MFGAEYLGTTQIVTLDTPHGRLAARLPSSASVRIGETVGLQFRSERLALSGFVFSAFVYGVIHIKANGFSDLFGVPVPLPRLPPWFDIATQLLMAAAALRFAGLAIAWCRRVTAV